MISVNRPTIPLRILSWCVRRGILRRGYARLLASLPTIIWGGRYISMTTTVGPMAFDTCDRGTVQMMLHGTANHEPEETLVVAQLAPYLTCAIDIGANVGWYTRLLQYHGERIRTVLAVEANPLALDILQLNCARFPSIEVIACAAGETDGESSFWVSGASNLSSSVRAVGRKVVARQTTIDTMCAGRQLLDHVDFIKCDVEGAEIQVLQGARRILSGAKPPIWMIEVEPQFLSECQYTTERVEQLVTQQGGEPQFFVARGGRLHRLAHIADKQGTNNVFVVPRCRLEQVRRLLNE